MKLKITSENFTSLYSDMKRKIKRETFPLLK